MKDIATSYSMLQEIPNFENVKLFKFSKSEERYFRVDRINNCQLNTNRTGGTSSGDGLYFANKITYKDKAIQLAKTASLEARYKTGIIRTILERVM